MSDSSDAKDVLGFIALALGWFQKLRSQPDLDHLDDFDSERETWNELTKNIEERLGEGLTLEAFLHEMDLSPKIPPPPPNATRCLTIHSAKDMEFEHVYVFALAEDQLPSFQAIKKEPNSREIQEERRNCFVAITRTQTSLTLTYARSYSGWRKAPSRFLSEMELLQSAE